MHRTDLDAALVDPRLAPAAKNQLTPLVQRSCVLDRKRYLDAADMVRRRDVDEPICADAHPDAGERPPEIGAVALRIITDGVRDVVELACPVIEQDPGHRKDRLQLAQHVRRQELRPRKYRRNTRIRPAHGASQQVELCRHEVEAVHAMAAHQVFPMTAAHQTARHHRAALIEHREQAVHIPRETQAAVQEHHRVRTDPEDIVLHRKKARPARIRPVHDLRRPGRAGAQHAEDIRLPMCALRQPRRLKEMRGARTAPDALQAVFPQDSPHFFRRHPVMQQDRARPDGLQCQERDQLADKIIRQDEDVAADTQKRRLNRHSSDAPPQRIVRQLLLIHDQEHLLRLPGSLPAKQCRIIVQAALCLLHVLSSHALMHL